MRDIAYELHKAALCDRGLYEAALELKPGIEADGVRCDFSSNYAMVLGKKIKTNPLDVAAAITSNLNREIFDSVEVVKPGFINIKVRAKVWVDLLDCINKVGTDYGDSNFGKGEKINAEFASANPTGPLHIGHIRGAIIGDTMAAVMKKVGFQVAKEYYINDAGAQVNTLAESAFLRYKEALGHDIGAIPEGLYPGDYLVSVGQALAEKWGDSLLQDDNALEYVKTFTISAMLEQIKSDMTALRVTYDQFVSENAIVSNNAVEDVLAILRQRGLVYEDIPEKPKGKSSSDWQERKQLLFRSTLFGDSADRCLIKEDGSWTYFAADIAYSFDKIKRGFNKLILVLGRDHIGYVTRLAHVIDVLSEKKARMVPIVYEIVNLISNGEVIKMSKRKGDFLSAQDVMSVMDVDVIRVAMLLRSNETVLDFDLQKITAATKDNPVFYIQYARARACSVLRKASEIALPSDTVDASLLSTASEKSLLAMLASWPQQLEVVAARCEPHKLVFYLQNLAKLFHSLWNEGKDNNDFRFIMPDKPELTRARLSLVQAVTHVLASGLLLMRITPLDEM